MRNTFKTYERLKREQHIDTLFRTGKAFSVLQVKFVYQHVPREAELSPIRVGFSVPKKKFKKAVHRHQLRRLLVEAWRLNKQDVYSSIPANQHIRLFILYIAREAVDFSTLQQSMQIAMKRLAETVASDNA